MSVNIKIRNIISSDNFKIYIKEGDSPYPIGPIDHSDPIEFFEYEEYGEYSGGTMTILLNDYYFKNDTTYWIMLYNLVTKRYIVENITTLICHDCEMVGIILDIECDFNCTAYIVE